MTTIWREVVRMFEGNIRSAFFHERVVTCKIIKPHYMIVNGKLASFIVHDDGEIMILYP